MTGLRTLKSHQYPGEGASRRFRRKKTDWTTEAARVRLKKENEAKKDSLAQSQEGI
jgi:hypothetical protein